LKDDEPLSLGWLRVFSESPLAPAGCASNPQRRACLRAHAMTSTLLTSNTFFKLIRNLTLSCEGLRSRRWGSCSAELQHNRAFKMSLIVSMLSCGSRSHHRPVRSGQVIYSKLRNVICNVTRLLISTTSLLSIQKVLSGSSAGRLTLMGKYIEHRLVARLDPDSPVCTISPLSPPNSVFSRVEPRHL